METREGLQMIKMKTTFGKNQAHSAWHCSTSHQWPSMLQNSSPLKNMIKWWRWSWWWSSSSSSTWTMPTMPATTSALVTSSATRPTLCWHLCNYAHSSIQASSSSSSPSPSLSLSLCWAFQLLKSWKNQLRSTIITRTWNTHPLWEAGCHKYFQLIHLPRDFAFSENPTFINFFCLSWNFFFWYIFYLCTLRIVGVQDSSNRRPPYGAFWISEINFHLFF